MVNLMSWQRVGLALAVIALAEPFVSAHDPGPDLVPLATISALVPGRLMPCHIAALGSAASCVQSWQ
jgi:hypothetical protein